MRFLIIYFLVQISFLGTVLVYFIQSNFKFFRRRPTKVANTFTQCIQKFGNSQKRLQLLRMIA